MSEIRIPLSVPSLRGNESRYLEECVRTNYVSSVGPFVRRFEDEFAGYTGAPHAVACASGTAALHLALLAAGVAPEDEVLVSDFTFIATVNPIAYVGAVPVLVDCDDATWNIDPSLVCDELERRARSGERMPRAVLAAHVLGLVADLAPVRESCDRHGVALIEDAAEALGAGYRSGPLAGRKVGTIGDSGCYSFNGNKIITSGGGGMVTTANEAAAARARHLSTQARLPGPEYLHDAIGYNYRLTNLAAAVGVAQLERLDSFLEKKRRIAARYDEALAGLAGITLPPRPQWAEPSMWLYSILIDGEIAGIARSGVAAFLRDRGIESRPVWAPAHRMPFFSGAKRLGGAVGDRIFRDGLSLPCSVDLTDDEQVMVIRALSDAMGHR